jgi:uncharacterized protein (TIGR00251 family)
LNTDEPELVKLVGDDRARCVVDPRKYHLHNGQKGSALAVRVSPRSAGNEITEISPDGTVKVNLTAPADDVKINQSLVNFLAEILQVPNGRIEIVAGAGGRDKLVSILDLDTAEVQERLLRKGI